ncbi:hypothetical protein DW094_05015 [Ruminococcaceae bacterium AM07-15]|nr:hypothetical protein DW094_05015 [Ruminococcaceae bacterium AM07-15]
MIIKKPPLFFKMWGNCITAEGGEEGGRVNIVQNSQKISFRIPQPAPLWQGSLYFILNLQ